MIKIIILICQRGRISSLINLINNYKNGSLKEYLYNGGLKIIELPLEKTDRIKSKR